MPGSEPNSTAVASDVIIREFRVDGDALSLSVPGQKSFARWRRVVRVGADFGRMNFGQIGDEVNTVRFVTGAVVRVGR